MEKELKALEHIDKTITSIRCYEKVDISDDVDISIEIVRQALTELQTIKEAEPSEALEGLKHIKKYYVPEPCSTTTYDYLEIIEQALIKAQKIEKAWKVVKEKNVSIFWLKECKSLEEYNYNTADYMKLTQEEFDFLKEMLENELF